MQQRIIIDICHAIKLEVKNGLIIIFDVSSMVEKFVRRNSHFSATEVKEAEKQLQRSQDQLSTSEEIARQLRMKEEDFTEALNAKDSQLAVLRVRMQESDQELRSKQQQIEEYQLERERSDNEKIQLNSIFRTCRGNEKLFETAGVQYS